jgi:protein disulfide-isomerase
VTSFSHVASKNFFSASHQKKPHSLKPAKKTSHQMSKLVIIAALFVAMVAASVVKLTPENYDTIVNDAGKDVFVKFYAPWCGHCVRMAPAWEELAKNNANPDVVIAEVDASQYQELAQKNGIRGFPTIKLFTKGNKAGIPFQGARDVPALESFLKANI